MASMAAVAFHVELLTCILLLTAAHFCTCVREAEGRARRAHSQRVSPSVAVVNGVGFHTEVYCALMWSLVQADANVSAYVLTHNTLGMENVISGWCLSQSCC